MEVILNKDLLKEDNEAKKLFKDDNKIKLEEINFEKDTEIVNLKNTVDDYRIKLNNMKNKYDALDKKFKSNGNRMQNLFIFILNIIIIVLGIYIFKNRQK